MGGESFFIFGLSLMYLGAFAQINVSKGFLGA